MGSELDIVFGAFRLMGSAVNTGVSLWQKGQAKRGIQDLHDQCYADNVQHRRILQAQEYSGQLPMLKNEVLLCTPSREEIRLALLPPKKIGTMQSAIVSGGKAAVRNRSVFALVENTLAHDVPIIALHCNNENLVQTLSSGMYGSRINIVEQGHMSYNPFFGMKPSQISKMLYDTIPEQYKVGLGTRDVIGVMAEVIFARNMIPGPATMSSCPIFELKDLIGKMAGKGYLDQAKARRLTADYVSSQGEVRALSHFLTDLNSQLARLTNENGRDGCDINEAIKNRDAVLINVGTNSNDLVIALVIHHLKLLFDQGSQFLLLLDGIDLAKYKDLQELVIHNRTGYYLSYDDLYVSVGSDEKMFSTVVGDVGKVIIFSTASGFTSAQWSKYLGDYERHEPKDGINIGSQGVIGANVSNNYSVDIKREARVPPEILTQLQGNQACVYDGTSNTIMFVDIT